MADSRHLHWGAEALWQELGVMLPGLSVEVVASADSTNTRLLERARLSRGWRNAPVTSPGQLDTTPAALDTPTTTLDLVRACALVVDGACG